MKQYIILFMSVFAVYALDDVAVPNTFVNGTTIFASEFNANYDTLEAFHNRLNDSVDVKFIRFADFTSGDSTITRLQVDTIRSRATHKGTNIDSIVGHTFIDSVILPKIITPTIVGGTANNMIIGGTTKAAGSFTNITGTGTIDFTGATVSDGGTVTTVNIDGGTIDGATIGATTASTGVFTTVNTGQGVNELHAMDQDVKTTDAPTFATVNTGNGANELFAMDQNVQTTDPVVFTTVNTGQGVTEVFLMNQDVRTSDIVRFDSVVVVTGILVGSDITLVGDIFTTDWTDYSGTSTIVGWSSFTTKQLEYKIVGDLVYVQFILEGTSNSTAASFTLLDANGSAMRVTVPLEYTDNGVGNTRSGLTTMGSSSATVDLFLDWDALIWTASGTKNAAGMFWYRK